MLKYIFNRLWQSVIVLIGVTMVTFILLNIAPGDPVDIMLERRTDEQTIELVRHELGLDRPLPVQYGDFLWKAMHGDLGVSYFQKVPVTGIVWTGLKTTLKLGGLALLLSTVLGVVFGTLSAVFRGKLMDRLLMFFSMLGISVPPFWVAVLMQIAFGLTLKWFPISGVDKPYAFVMPVLVLSLSFCASTARLVRTNMIEELGQDYVRTAKAKGLSEFVLVCKHVMKNSAIPVITLIGMQLRSLISAAMVVETVFSLPGLGKVAFAAITARDIPLIQGTVLTGAVLFVVINLAIDLLYGVLDPRIRLAGGTD